MTGAPLNIVPTLPLPGTWGVAHGSGFLGDMIRYVEQEESKSARFPEGDHEAAWAGHVIVAIGDDHLVEAEWPKVVVSPLTAHPDAIWATGQPLTARQHLDGCDAVLALVGAQYDALAYAYFLAKLAEIPLTRDFAALEREAAKAGPICSGVMVREQEAMGVDIGPLRTAAIQSPDFISPADCLRWMIDNGWNHKPVPAW